jgi:hypothetical protein
VNHSVRHQRPGLDYHEARTAGAPSPAPTAQDEIPLPTGLRYSPPGRMRGTISTLLVPGSPMHLQATVEAGHGHDESLAFQADASCAAERVTTGIRRVQRYRFAPVLPTPERGRPERPFRAS